MKPKQDYSFALDSNHCLIYVKYAQKGVDYFCPCCGAIMIPKQGKKNRWHFAHKGNLGNCAYESYLHKIAKKRIRECFNNSSKFMIEFNQNVVCAITECPLGNSKPCDWNTLNSYDLKEFYNSCEEEVTIGNFRADLLLTNADNDIIPPILIEIKVSHKSTEEKLNSEYKVIEIGIESEDEIDKIVSLALISEKQFCFNKDKLSFHNFNSKHEIPDVVHQPYRYRFWIDSKKYYHFVGNYIKPHFNYDGCLSPNSYEVEHSLFRIESQNEIGWDFAFQQLSQSGLGIKYCNMCHFYRYNELYSRKICILYKSKGTTRIPKLSDAESCPYYKRTKYMPNELMQEGQEFKITINKPTE